MDIIVTFNEVDYRVKREYAPRLLRGEPFGFVDQMCALGSSAVQRVPGAKLWGVHTRPLPPGACERLEGHGWRVVHRERPVCAPHEERLQDRLQGFTVGRSRVQLFLDSDMIFTGPMRLPDAPIAVGYAGGPVFSHDVWSQLCDLAGVRGVTLEDLRAPAFTQWFEDEQRSGMPFFNNGALMLRRSRRREYVSRMLAVREAFASSGLIESTEMLGHFLDQVCMSLVVRSNRRADLLPPGMNALRTRLDLSDPTVRAKCTLVHYLSHPDVEDVARWWPEPFEAALASR